MPRYRTEQIATALTECKGMVYVAARRLGCSPNTIKKRLEEVPTLREHLEAEHGLMGDTAELKLFQAIQSGEAWAIQFFLKTQGKGRGYVERTEHTGPGGGAIEQRTEHRGVVEVRAVDYRQSIRALAPLALEEGDEGGDAGAHEGAA